MANPTVYAATPGWMVPIWDTAIQMRQAREVVLARDWPTVPDGCQYAASCNACGLPDCMIGDSYNGQRAARLGRQVERIRLYARMGATPGEALKRAGMSGGGRDLAIAQRAILSDPLLAEGPAKAALREEVLRVWQAEQRRKQEKGA